MGASAGGARRQVGTSAGEPVGRRQEGGSAGAISRTQLSSCSLSSISCRDSPLRRDAPFASGVATSAGGHVGRWARRLDPGHRHGSSGHQSLHAAESPQLNFCVDEPGQACRADQAYRGCSSLQAGRARIPGRAHWGCQVEQACRAAPRSLPERHQDGPRSCPGGPAAGHGAPANGPPDRRTAFLTRQLTGPTIRRDPPDVLITTATDSR